MPSSINSTSSSPGGLISTGATDNELEIKTGDTTAISIDASQNVTVAGDLTVNGTLVGGGDVVGPASATDNAVARFDGTTGKLIQNSSLVVNDSGEITAGVWQGTEISVAKGGTGATTLTANNVILGNGTSAVQFVAPGANGNVLTSNGTTWTSAAGGGVLAGTVIWFAANTAPTGYLKANGANVSRTTYASLFAAIGTTFGVGDGSTTFGLPDLRGEFIRGWDDGRGIDSGRVFGSAQADQMQQITGAIIGAFERVGFTNSGALSYTGGSNNRTVGTGTGVVTGGNLNFDSAGSSGARTGTETRSRNIALLACIKF